LQIQFKGFSSLKTNRFLLALVVTASLSISNAVAGNYSFEFLASGYQVNANLTTADTLNAVNGYDILGISGTVTGFGGGAITSLVSNPNQPFPIINYGFEYNNVLFPNATPTLDIDGVLFRTTGGAIWNLWGTTATDYRLYSYWPVAVDVHSSNMSVVAVPEPGTYAMILAGLGIMGFVARRRTQQAV
jgi:hypothetical protein